MAVQINGSALPAEISAYESDDSLTAMGQPGQEFSTCDSDSDTAEYGEEEPSMRLKQGIDLADLGAGKPVTFELEQEQFQEKPPRDYFQKPNPKEMYDMSKPGILFDDSSDEDEEAEESQFKKISHKMTDVTSNKDGGVLKKIVKQGTGRDIPSGALVKVHYRGFLEFSDEAFDSTHLTGKQKSWTLCTGGDILPAFDVAASTMKKGELSYFLTSPDYNFGKMGCPPRIPPEASILWEIEMVAWTEHAEVDDFYSLSREDRKSCKIEMILKVAEIAREECKALFKSKNFYKAANKYRRAIESLENYRMKDEEEERKIQKELLMLFVNTALVYSRTPECGRVVTYANSALRIDSNHVKALYLKGKGLHQLSDFKSARFFLLEAQKRQPNSADINDELKRLDSNMKKFNLQEKALYQRMFALPVDDQGKKTSNSESQNTDREESVKKQGEEYTAEFRDNMRQYLQNFLDNEDLQELPFPQSIFTVGELNCIEDLGNEMGIAIKEIGEGSNAHMRFAKKT